MVSLLHTEARGDMSRNIGMPLFIPNSKQHQIEIRKMNPERKAERITTTSYDHSPLILADKVQIVAAHNDGPIHFSTVACASKDATSD